jgi:hypothetical protein
MVGLAGLRSREPAQSQVQLQLETLEDRSTPNNLFADLADVDQFTVLALTGAKVDISNPKTLFASSPGFPANVGLGPGARENFSDGTIQGNLIVDPTANITKSNHVHENAIVVRDLSPDVMAAIDASNQIAALAPTLTLPSIHSSTTLHSTGAMNVINVTDLTLDGSAQLTLQGRPGMQDYFFINVTGKYAQTGNSSIRLVNVPGSHVVFNIVGTGQQVAFTGKSVGAGTYLAVNRDIAVTGATVNGALIGGLNHQISIVSGSQLHPTTSPFPTGPVG